MKKTIFILGIIASFSSISFAQTTLKKSTVVGGEGGWDYLSVSAEDRRLYLSHGNQVEVLM